MGQKDPVKLYRDTIEYRFYIGICSFYGKPFISNTYATKLLDGLFHWGDDLL
jgi:hypothetical protein